jgi:hypothetical protein
MRFLFFLLLPCVIVRADSQSELKAALARLNGREPVQARVDFQLSSRSGDAKQPVVEEAAVTARVEAGPTGLRISWSPEQIQAAAQEAKAPEAETKAPIRRAMAALTATTLHDYLNGSAELLHTLEQAQLVDEKTESWQGQPARLLTFKLTPRIGEKDRKYIKELVATAKIWVGGNGVPLAAESRMHLKGRAMLVISFESAEMEEFRFAQAGDRLVVIRHVKENSGSGGGESGQQKTIATLTLGEG